MHKFRRENIFDSSLCTVRCIVVWRVGHCVGVVEKDGLNYGSHTTAISQGESEKLQSFFKTQIFDLAICLWPLFVDNFPSVL